MADRLARRWSLNKFKRRGPARVAEGERNHVAFQVIKPWTYMNRSGAALVPLADDATFDPDRDLLVLVDDVALDLGQFRLRAAGSAGGHNGLKSIEAVLQAQTYARLRIGVGPRPMDYDDLADYVLDRFATEERRALEEVLDPMAEAVECWFDEGIEVAMNRFNRRPLAPSP